MSTRERALIETRICSDALVNAVYERLDALGWRARYCGGYSIEINPADREPIKMTFHEANLFLYGAERSKDR